MKNINLFRFSKIAIWKMKKHKNESWIIIQTHQLMKISKIRN